MARGSKDDRIRNAFRKTFKTAHGKTVLMHLYEKLFGNQSTFPKSCDPYAHAFNEGQRMALLMIVEELREQDWELRKMYEEHINERYNEEMRKGMIDE